MRFKPTFINVVSIGLMLGGLYLAVTNNETFVAKRFVFTIVGILGWFVGNHLVQLEERIAELESQHRRSEPDPRANPLTEPSRAPLA